MRNRATCVTSLHIYPVKSCGGLLLDQTTLDARGPAFDRRWMIVSDDGGDPARFVTQRELPRLALIQPELTADELILRAPGMPEMKLPLRARTQRLMDVVIWRDTCQATNEGSPVALWLSEFLGARVQLVRMAAHEVRPVDPAYAREPAQVGFADGYPLLLISQGSLDDLNDRLRARGKSPVPMNRFRPNLVVDGCEPYAEDTWRTIRIGGVTFDLVKPCARCATTTVDQGRGAVPDAQEPLATLATYRRGANGGVMFGQNIIHHSTGRLEVGMPVEVMD